MPRSSHFLIEKCQNMRNLNSNAATRMGELLNIFTVERKVGLFLSLTHMNE